MKIRHIAIPAFMALALAACAADGGKHDHHDHGHDHARRDMAAKDFVCENGMKVRVQFLEGNKIRLNTDGQSVVMENAVAASGERYAANSGLFGNGGEWHQKGGEAMFAFTKRHGGQVETACSQQ